MDAGLRGASSNRSSPHTSPPLSGLDLSYQRAGAAGWELHDLACGHDAMIEVPEATADLLEAIARD